MLDPDIGACDMCGSEKGPRWQRFSDGAWLCEDCTSTPVNETDLDWWENRGGPE